MIFPTEEGMKGMIPGWPETDLFLEKNGQPLLNSIDNT